MAWYKCVIQKNASPDALINKSITSVNSEVTNIGPYAFYQCENLASANFPNATVVGIFAFSGCNHLASITLPNAVTVYASAFTGASRLTSINLPKCTQIYTSAFNGCSALTSISAPEAVLIISNAFQDTAITRINFPKVTSVSGSFCYMALLSAVDFDNELPKITDIGQAAFLRCTSLSQIISATNIKSIGTNAFNGCPLTDSSMAKFTEVTSVGSGGFANVTGCTNVTLPSVLNLSGSAFSDSTVQYVYLPKVAALASSIWANSALKRADFGQNLMSTSLKIAASTFKNATNFTELILRGTSNNGVGVIPLNNVNAFAGTPFANGGSGGTIYVPRALVSAYKSATNWSTILGYGSGQQNQILALEDSPYATEPS